MHPALHLLLFRKSFYCKAQHKRQISNCSKHTFVNKYFWHPTENKKRFPTIMNNNLCIFVVQDSFLCFNGNIKPIKERFLENTIVGHAFLVDCNGLVRWKAHANPTDEEIKFMLDCSKLLLKDRQKTLGRIRWQETLDNIDDLRNSGMKKLWSLINNFSKLQSMEYFHVALFIFVKWHLGFYSQY